MSEDPPHADGTTPSRKETSDETTRRLLEFAVQEFVERGFEAARVHNIARRAGLTVGAAYGRWPHKSDLMVAALDYALEQILPDPTLKNLDGAAMQPSAMMALLGANLPSLDNNRDILVQVFGDARNNEAIRMRLQQFLNEERQHLSRLVELGKDAGYCDPGYSTAAITLLCQSIGIGVHMLISAGMEDRHIPSEDQWNTLLSTLIKCRQPRATQPP